MIRQLRRLTRPVPAFGPGVSAIAIYSEATRRGMRERCAAESGFEGVACVDDTARLASLYIALWRRDGKPRWRSAALEALGFVRAMQTPEGSFVNFITNWDGAKNLRGRTSGDPHGPWLARACHALADGAAAFGDRECKASFERAMPWLEDRTPYLDIRAVATLAALRYHDATGATVDAQRAARWAGELYESRRHGILPDQAGCSTVHLWGHLQECALAEAGATFGRPEWVEAARDSAERLLAPAIDLAFRGLKSIAFDVSCAVRGVEAVGRVTGESRYAKYADRGRAWFDGRNAAAATVFDRRRGLVYDGIDGVRLNPNSGAESNIEAGLALVNGPAAAALNCGGRLI